MEEFLLALNTALEGAPFKTTLLIFAVIFSVKTFFTWFTGTMKIGDELEHIKKELEKINNKK